MVGGVKTAGKGAKFVGKKIVGGAKKAGRTVKKAAGKMIAKGVPPHQVPRVQ